MTGRRSSGHRAAPIPVGSWRGRLGWVVLVAFGILTLSWSPVGAAAHHSGPRWVAHSAYGLELSVPATWTVAYFLVCPFWSKPGILSIGHSAVAAACPAYQPQDWSDIARVTMDDVAVATSGAGMSPTHTMVVHGLRVEVTNVLVERPIVQWYVPSHHALLTGQGPGALRVLHTLRAATPSAVVAPGRATGNEYLGALSEAGVSGQVTATALRTGRSFSTLAFNGLYSFSAPPGRYVVRGGAASAECPPVAVRLVSGVNGWAPPIRCQGI